MNDCPLRRAVAVAMLHVLLTTGAFAAPRDRPRIVGPAVLAPFSEAVAARYAARAGDPAPKVDVTGEASAIKLFCGGVGPGFPDLATTTRPITEAERRDCASNGVTGIIAAAFGAIRAPGGGIEEVPALLLLKTPDRDSARGLGVFSREYLSDAAIGPDGYLARLGLDPLPAAERAAAREAAALD